MATILSICEAVEEFYSEYDEKNMWRNYGLIRTKGVDELVYSLGN